MLPLKAPVSLDNLDIHRTRKEWRNVVDNNTYFEAFKLKKTWRHIILPSKTVLSRSTNFSSCPFFGQFWRFFNTTSFCMCFASFFSVYRFTSCFCLCFFPPICFCTNFWPWGRRSWEGWLVGNSRPHSPPPDLLTRGPVRGKDYVD